MTVWDSVKFWIFWVVAIFVLDHFYNIKFVERDFLVNSLEKSFHNLSDSLEVLFIFISFNFKQPFSNLTLLSLVVMFVSLDKVHCSLNLAQAFVHIPNASLVQNTETVFDRSVRSTVLARDCNNFIRKVPWTTFKVDTYLFHVNYLS